MENPRLAVQQPMDASARVLQFVFGVYLVAVLAAYVVPSAIGENIARFRYAAIPLAVLVLSLRRWRPYVAALAVLGIAIAWNVTPLAASFVRGEADTTEGAATWTQPIAYLHAHLRPGYRVEVVDTATHWPEAYLADSHIPLARGCHAAASSGGRGPTAAMVCSFVGTGGGRTGHLNEISSISKSRSDRGGMVGGRPASP